MRVLALAGVAVLWVGSASASSAKAPCGLSGSFRVYSNILAFDTGGRGRPPAVQQLTLSGNTWQSGRSKGRFTTTAITRADWKMWKVVPYGPTTKLVLSGWRGRTTTGPIEIQSNAVNYVWVIYRVMRPKAGLVEVRFAHSATAKSCT